MEFPPCRVITRDAISCCEAPYTNTTDGDAAHHLLRMLASKGHDTHHSFCEAGYVETSTAAGCDPHAHQTVHDVHAGLLFTSVVILVLFEVELVALFAALEFNFCRNPLYVLDWFIVTASLIVELYVYINTQTFNDWIGLLILMRAWRFVRIGHGLLTSFYETEHGHVEMMEEDCDELELHIEHLESEIMLLRNELAKSQGALAEMASVYEK